MSVCHYEIKNLVDWKSSEKMVYSLFYHYFIKFLVFSNQMFEKIYFTDAKWYYLPLNRKIFYEFHLKISRNFFIFLLSKSFMEFQSRVSEERVCFIVKWRITDIWWFVCRYGNMRFNKQLIKNQWQNRILIVWSWFHKAIKVFE